MDRLHWRLGGLFLAVIVFGSVACVLWMDWRLEVARRADFKRQAETLAGFIAGSRLPLSERTATSLSEALGMDVYFREDNTLTPVPQERAVARELTRKSDARSVFLLSTGGEAVWAEVGDRGTLGLLRESRGWTVSLWHPATLALLTILWAVVLAATWLVYRVVVAPVRSLARAVPEILENPHQPVAEALRRDEIGVLARSFLESGRQLRDERRLRGEAERLAMLGRITTGLAHEIRNPVSAIRMHAQLLQREQAAAARTGVESARLILHQADRVESLVNQWLFLARPEPPARSPVDLGALVASEVETLGAMAEHAGVTLEVDAVPGAIVSGDRLRLAQVIENVVRNAIQASPPGGSVRIGVRTDASGEATVTVRDAGDGFSAAALEQGAEMFFSEKEGGMGVGLSLVRQVVLGHGGKLVLGNERGAVVSIRLPLQPGEGSGS